MTDIVASDPNVRRPAADAYSYGVKMSQDPADQSVMRYVRLPTDQSPIPVTGFIAVVIGTITRVADTNAYASGDLIANSVTAGSVIPLTLALARAADKSGMIRRVRVKANAAGWAGIAVRAHFYKNTPTVTNGDNGAFLSTESDHIGYVDVTLDRHFSDFEKGIGVPASGSELNFEPASGTQNVYMLLEARAAVATPGSGTVFTVACEVHQN